MRDTQIFMVPMDIPPGYHPFMYLFSSKLYKGQAAGMDGLSGVLHALGAALVQTSTMPDEYRKNMTVEGLANFARAIVADVLSADESMAVSAETVEQAHKAAASCDAPAEFNNLINQVVRGTNRNWSKRTNNDDPLN